MLRTGFRPWLSTAVAAVALAIAGSAHTATCDDAIPTTLQDYVARPDASYAWKVRDTKETSQGRMWELDLTSQTWHGIVWKHTLLVFEPPKVRFPNQAILFITGGRIGGRPRDENLVIGFKLAELAQARVAMLHQVPNQPLLDNRKEDDLITETWLRFLGSGDVTWVLQLPMVNSAVRAMDAVQALAKAQWNGPIEGFVVTGASKRGWTSWLTAVADKRAVAIAPMVIDMLNLPSQMKYQLETWGQYSEQIDDYTKKGLIREGDLATREAQLLRLVDPYTYRSQLTLPKLLIHGTNDPYWCVDAAKLYWDDLSGPKYLHEVANAGHGLQGGQLQALETLGVFFRHVATATPGPEVTWKHSDDGRDLVLQIRSSPSPKGVRLWVARSPTKDFRKAKWTSEPLSGNEGTFAARVPKPQEGHVAFYGEVRFEYEGVPCSACTLVRRY